MMHRRILLGMVLAVLLPTLLYAQEQWLRGKVVRVGELGQEVPEVNVTVTIEEVGNSGNTTSQGVFRIALPPVFRAGDRVTLMVDKPEWCIHHPWGGEARIPADLQKELLKVQLVPLGDTVLKSPDNLEKLILKPTLSRCTKPKNHILSSQYLDNPPGHRGRSDDGIGQRGTFGPFRGHC